MEPTHYKTVSFATKLAHANGVLLVAVFSIGCSIQTAMDNYAGEPHTLSAQELSRYNTIGELIGETTGSSIRKQYSWPNHQLVIQPYHNARSFCEYQGGKLVKVGLRNKPTTSSSYRSDSESIRENGSLFLKRMDESFGEFECRGGELSSSWAVIIEASNVEHILRRDSWNRPTIISNAGEATVTTTAFNDYEEWLSFRKEREAEEARLEEKRIVANAKAAAERDRRAHLAAEARRIENDRIYQAQQVLLKNLGLGTETHCGMVIDLREGLVEVQTEVAGNRWFRKAQLFAPGDAPCRFLNGEYQEP